MRKLRKKITELSRNLKKIRASLNIAPKSQNISLWTSHGKNRDRYYLKENGKKRCLQNNEINIARMLAQYEFNNSLAAIIDEIVEHCARLSELLIEPPWEQALKLLPPAKRALVNSPVPGDKAKSEKWLSLPREFLNYKTDEAICSSKKGEMFRSKSEAMIADFLDESGITYVHDCKVTLNNGIEYYPDFIIYMPHTEREIIWEHFGIMGDQKYAAKAITKICDYVASGYQMGLDFYCSFEALLSPLNSNFILQTINTIIEDNT